MSYVIPAAAAAGGLSVNPIRAAVALVAKRLTGRPTPPPTLPSLTAAFACRRAIFGAFDGGKDHG